jgi:hypothetical protein
MVEAPKINDDIDICEDMISECLLFEDQDSAMA